MDHTSLELRSFKLHLTIPMNQRASLPQEITLVYRPRIDKTSLKINDVEIPPNKPALIVLRRVARVMSAEVVDESNVVFASTDRVCAGDGLKFEVCIRGKIALKGIFQRGVRRGLACEQVDLPMWAEVRVTTAEGFSMNSRVRYKRQQFYPKLPTIVEEDEVEEEEEIRKSDCSYCAEKKKKDEEDGAGKKDYFWAINAGIFVACIGVGFFIFRAPLKRLVGFKLF